jgi:hypothetical protein
VAQPGVVLRRQVTRFDLPHALDDATFF